MNRFFNFIRRSRKDIYRGLLFIVSIVLLVLIFPKEGTFKYEFQKGKPWMHDDLIAPFDFALLKSSEEIQGERLDILKDHRLYFTKDSISSDDILLEYQAKFEREWARKHSNNASGNELKSQNLRVGYNILDTIFNRGIIKLTADIENRPGYYQINLISDNAASPYSLDDFFTIRSAYDFIRHELNRYQGIDKELLESLLDDLLIQNVVYDEATTNKEREALLSNISVARGMVQSGERIISKGELVTGEKARILESLKSEYEVQLGSSSSYYLILVGQIFLISVSIIVLIFFLLFFRKDIYASFKKILLVLLLIILMVFITSLVVTYNVGLLYLVPICLNPIVIRAFFDTRLALYVHIITIITIGFLVPNSFEFVFSQLIAGIIAVFSVVNLQKRSQFFLASLMIFLTYSLIYVGLSLIQEGNFVSIKPVYFALFAGSAVLTLFSYPMIYILEKLFGLITDVTLIELSNTNTKLLRLLARKAPGTFQHSLQVANLAEEVIFEIGGNALLIRTGALYHDVGKIDHPEYFVENQMYGINPHDKLSFEESARVIIDHVQKGVEKARRYNLPQQIIDFIITHHGTRRVEYFYMKQLEEHPYDKVNVSRYTYPGPRPFTRETAVLMIADSVEAASRSIKEPDAEKIDTLVDSIFNRMVEHEQFIYSDITLRELTRIKELLKKNLMSIYHVRIEYPDQENS